MKQALLDLLQANSFASLTVADVLREAAVSRASFYFYFSSLTGLLAELARDAVSTLMATYSASLQAARGMSGSAAGSTGSPTWIDTGVRVAAAFWRENGALLRAIVETSSSDPALHGAWREQLDAVAQLFLVDISQDPEATEWFEGRDATTFALVAAILAERLFYMATCGEAPFDDEPTLVSTLIDHWSLTMRGHRA